MTSTNNTKAASEGESKPPREEIVQPYSINRSKYSILASIVIAAMLTLMIRLAWLQVLQQHYYKERSVENSTRVVFLRAPRGIIYDRHGHLLAANKQTLSIVVVPAMIEDISILAGRLSAILDEPTSEVAEKLEAAKTSRSVLPVVLEHDVDLRIVGRFLEQKIFLPGVDVMPDISRVYPLGDVMAHALGYTGEITANQLQKRPERRMGDIVGQDGLERLYDVQLRGMDGEQRVRVNASGGYFSVETSKPKITRQAQGGQSIVTSLDLDLQKIAYDLLGERHGAVVACDPRTGEILVLVSKPSFDPNSFTKRVTPAVWKQLNAPDHPLFNRALSGFPPGSTWKAITLLAALDSGAVKPDTKLHVSGGIALGNFFFHDWTSRTGLFDLIQCLAWSRDSAFYQMALHMTPEQIKKWGVLLGAGRPTGVELLHESSGTVPDSAWKLKYMHDKWYPGNTLHVAIGQSFLEITPTQMVRMYSGISMRGKVPNLHLVVKIGNREIPAPEPEHVTIKPEYMNLVLNGLKAVVASGTGGATRLGNVEVAGKTGSAEAPPLGSKTHAWFCCYAPADHPRIAICAFVEHGGHGGSAAAPIARAMLEKYFSISKPEAWVKAAPAVQSHKAKSKAR